jgi:hypothetical protein
MKVVMNGHEITIPDQKGQIQTSDIWRAAGVKPGRQQMVLQQPNGGNIILNPTGTQKIAPGSFVTSVMLRERGREH